MKTAREFWKEKWGEEPQTTTDMLAVVMMTEYAEVLKVSYAWAVFNINGDLIGIADSFGKALSIYEERYGDTPDVFERIRKVEMNKLLYV
jgi:hypothetical protein